VRPEPRARAPDRGWLGAGRSGHWRTPRVIPLRDTIPSRRPPLVVVLLILANALAFAYELSLSEDGIAALVERRAIVPEHWAGFSWDAVVAEPRAAAELVLTLVSSMFLHGGWLHVIGNLWMLWIFGDNVEDRMGHRRFLAFYVLCGLAAGVAHVLANPGSELPTIGASGAIAGVMGAYFVLFPRAKVITLIPILFYPLFVELPAIVYLGIWFLSQVLSGQMALANPDEPGGIAFLAHVGGFLAGALGCWLFKRRERD